jgi:hypothetical protein
MRNRELPTSRDRAIIPSRRNKTASRGKQPIVTTEELDRKFAEVAEIQKQTALQMQETDRRIQETDRQIQAVGRQLGETDRQIQDVNRQLGGLGEKFGSFTEGMAFPSMRKILEERFQMNVVTPRVRARQNGRTMEVDVLAVSTTNGSAYVVEVKSHLREEGLRQMLQTLHDFREFFPMYADKKVYGILAVVDAPESLCRRVLQAGLYLARIHDGQFEIQVPESFEPQPF